MNTDSIVRYLKQYPLVIACAVLSLILGAFYFLRSGKVEVYDEEILRLDKELKQMERNIINAQGIDDDVAVIKELSTQIEARLIDPEARVKEFQMLLSIEEQSGMELGEPALGTLLKTGKGSRVMTAKLPQLQYNFTATDSFEKCLNFIHVLEHGQPFMVIDKMSIFPEGANAEKELNITLTTRALAKN